MSLIYRISTLSVFAILLTLAGCRTQKDEPIEILSVTLVRSAHIQEGEGIQDKSIELTADQLRELLKSFVPYQRSDSLPPIKTKWVLYVASGKGVWVVKIQPRDQRLVFEIDKKTYLGGDSVAFQKYLDSPILQSQLRLNH